MKVIQYGVLTFVFLLVEYAFAEQPKHIAIVEFSVIGELGIPHAGQAVAEMLQNPIRRTGKFVLMEKTLLRSELSEQQICGSVLAENCMAKEVGKLQGVTAIVTGSVVKFADVVTVGVRMIDASTGEAMHTSTLRIPLHQLRQLPEKLNPIALNLAEKTIQQPVSPKQLTLIRSTKDLPESLDALIHMMSNAMISKPEGRRIYVNPVVEVNDRYTSDFSEYLTRRLKLGLGRQVISNKTTHKALSNTRAMRVRIKKVKNVSTNDAFFSGADAVLDGVYFADRQGINIALQLKDLSGQVITSTERFIRHTLVSMSTENPSAKKMAQIADVESQNAQGQVHIATGKGGVASLYQEGDHIQFILQVKQPLYISIFNINSTGKISLLFPGTGDQDFFQPGELYTIPSFKAKWHIQVEPPFGTDIVKVFASNSRLAPPELLESITPLSFRQGTRSVSRDRVQTQLATKRTIHPFDLVDYFRGQAKREEVNLYEDSLFVKTVIKIKP